MGDREETIINKSIYRGKEEKIILKIRMNKADKVQLWQHVSTLTAAVLY